MLFVSPRTQYVLVIQQDVIRRLPQANGSYFEDVVTPGFEAHFTQGCVMTPLERRAALTQIMARGEHALGALPHMSAGVLDSSEATDGKRREFNAVDPAFRVAGFRTDDEDQCPPEFREAAEARLTNPRLGFGTDWVRVEAAGVPKPWPAYDETHHSKIVEMVVAFGLDAEQVFDYEAATKNRVSVIKALDELRAKQAGEAFEQRDLEVSI